MKGEEFLPTPSKPSPLSLRTFIRQTDKQGSEGQGCAYCNYVQVPSPSHVGRLAVAAFEGARRVATRS